MVLISVRTMETVGIVLMLNMMHRWVHAMHMVSAETTDVLVSVFELAVTVTDGYDVSLLLYCIARRPLSSLIFLNR